MSEFTMQNHNEAFLTDLEEKLRQGEIPYVKQQLHRIKDKHKVPRSRAADFADMARKVNLPLLALQILAPILKEERELIRPATAREKLVFAASLVRVGSYLEANRLFKEIPWRQEPEVLLHQSFLYFRSWKYKSSIPLLKKFIGAMAEHDYKRTVGELNLAASLVAGGDWQQSAELLEKILETSTSKSYRLVKGGCLELLAQVAIYQKDYQKARSYLSQAKKQFDDGQSLQRLFLQKWEAITDLFETPSPSHIKRLRQIREQSVAANHWESARECDFFLAMANQDTSSLEKIYAGTPYQSYRKRMTLIYGKPLQSPSSYLWNGHHTSQPKEVIDLATGEGPSFSLSTTPLLLNTLRVLAMDFYQPASLGKIFDSLYPGDVFDPASSPTRVSQAIQRVRKLFSDHQVDIEILGENGSYQLCFQGIWGLKTHASYKGKKTNKELSLQLLKTRWPYRSFSIRAAADHLNVSPRTISSLFKWALAQNRIYKTGRGPATRYRFR